MAKLIAIVTGYFFVVYGLLLVFIPQDIVFWVTDASLTSSSAIIDTRATDGGLSLAAGITVLILSRQNLSLSLLITAIILFAMAFGRTIGIIWDGNANIIMWIYLISEVVAGLLALFYRHKSKAI